MKPVVVRNLIIGEGIPKICVPIVGVSKEEIIEQARMAGSIRADLAEWRADWFEGVFEQEQVEDVLRELRVILGETPLLFTFRTAAEGGERAMEPADYAGLLAAAAQTGCVDLVDVEAFMGDAVVKKLIAAVHRAGVKVVASNHDFEKTPEQAQIIWRLRRMQELGADISKIAVMPQSKKDVLTLLAATEEMCREYAVGPVITMAMGGMGMVSRLCGEVFGSAVTFGAAKRASAPGQVGVQELKDVLGILHAGLERE